MIQFFPQLIELSSLFQENFVGDVLSTNDFRSQNMRIEGWVVLLQLFDECVHRLSTTFAGAKHEDLIGSFKVLCNGRVETRASGA